MTETQIDTILRGNLNDSREMQTETELDDNDSKYWFYTEQVASLQKLIMFGTLEQKTKIANP